MRYLVLTFFFLLAAPILFMPSAAFAAADNFVWPLGVWNTSVHHGDAIGSGYYHMGVDAGFDLEEGAPVYAVADGQVKEAQVRSRFGLVVLVEHTLPDGKKIVSLYGHLKPGDIPKPVGAYVEAGERIGSLGNESENGGWSVHIHFGIHKDHYTGEWVYYGHVTDPGTADEWYNPEEFIPDHMTADVWKPNVAFVTDSNGVVSDNLNIKAYVDDIGSGIDTVKVRMSDDGQETWTTIASEDSWHQYPYDIDTSLSAAGDGLVYVRVTARDQFGNEQKQTTQIVKKDKANTSPFLVTMPGKGWKSEVKAWAQTGRRVSQFNAYKAGWRGQDDIAVGDVTGNGKLNIVTVKGKGSKAAVRVYNQNGKLFSKFLAFPKWFKNGGRITTGDIDGDGTDEIIVGSGPGITTRVKVFDYEGNKLANMVVFKNPHKGGVDVAAGDLDGDGDEEILAGSRSRDKSKLAALERDGTRLYVIKPFGNTYQGGLNITTAQLNGNPQEEIVVATNGKRSGQTRVFKSDGTRIDRKYYPFGADFEGPVDVANYDWDLDGRDEIMMSQAGKGEAWVKVYRFEDTKDILMTQRMYPEGFEGGTRIDGWQ